ncbi:MAG: bifunctional oligoribonuclease/PAP phosphatase NrnA [Candidatus Pacearchaeota archaeon]|jgi:phosphoesterase RecJ-like protein
MKNNTPNEILHKLKSSNNILMTLHYGPDGDSVGSCLAMKYFLENNLKKNVKVISNDDVPENMNSLDYIKEIEFNKSFQDIKIKDYDLLIFLDSDILMIPGQKIPEDIFTINIDHHKTNSYFAKLNYIDSTKASACSVLLDLFKIWNIKFDKKLSQRLLLGVATDSGFFSYENSVEAMRDSLFLIDNGADYLEGVLRPILYNQPLRLFKFNGKILNNFKIDKRAFGYSILTKEEIKETGVNNAEARLGINQLQFISGLKFVFVLLEFEDHIKGSFRSKKGYDVSVLAKDLGGGGHKEAAAFSFKNITLDKAKKLVFNEIDKLNL